MPSSIDQATVVEAKRFVEYNATNLGELGRYIRVEYVAGMLDRLLQDHCPHPADAERQEPIIHSRQIGLASKQGLEEIVGEMLTCGDCGRRLDWTGTMR